MKRIVLALLVAVVVAFLLLTTVALTSDWARNMTSIRVHYTIGATVVGIATGSASAWFAPTRLSAGMVAVIVLVPMYAPYSAPASSYWVVKPALALACAAVAISVVTSRRTGLRT